MDAGELNTSPGFRRRIIVTPASDRVTAAVEDDYHCMTVTLHHDGVTITKVDPVMHRAPWTTCPGAAVVLTSTFVGVALADVATRGAKQANCTHLHDMAVLAAAHAHDTDVICYDILACDPVDGVVTAEICRNGAMIHRIEHRDDVVISPQQIAGVSLFKLRPWIESLSGLEREAAKLFQWGIIIAHGRTTPMEKQSDASRMPPNCYTFQPERKDIAVRVGKIIDFSRGPRAPLS